MTHADKTVGLFPSTNVCVMRIFPGFSKQDDGRHIETPLILRLTES